MAQNVNFFVTEGPKKVKFSIEHFLYLKTEFSSAMELFASKSSKKSEIFHFLGLGVENSHFGPKQEYANLVDL